MTLAPKSERVTFLAFGQAVAPQNPRHRALKGLFTILSELHPRCTPEEREESIVCIARWVRTASKVPLDDTGYPLPSLQGKRLAILARALELFPAFRESVSELVSATLVEESALGLFARVGIPSDRGLVAETVDRLSRRLMPEPVDEQDLTHLLLRMFPKSSDPQWLEALHPRLLGSFIRLVRERDDAQSGDASAFTPLRAGLLDAILLLSSRVSSAGLSDAIRARSHSSALRESPFFRLPRAIDAFLASPQHDVEGAANLADECRAIVKDCRGTWSAVLDRLETQGVSVDVVYRLELIDRCLRRIELLLSALVPQSDEELGRNAAKILAEALEARRRDRSLTDIVRTNTRLLARKIIERAGETGEHYITTTRREYVGMLWSAGGGGFITATTVVIKVYCTNLHRPPLQEGVLHAANYASSFLLMQLLGFSLATKQSSMTAARLAGSIKTATGDASDLVTMIARVTRSQLAAAFGNVAIVIPASLGCDLLYEHYYGSHYFTTEYAHHFVASIQANDPWLAVYAGVTGILLWASSLAAGWLENWAVYRRLPEAIAQHRIKRFVGERVTKWASRAFAHNIAGFGGNVAIGALLGLTPVICRFAGIPIDIRHITLSTGGLALSVATLGAESLGDSDVQRGALGVLVIGAMNFGVSFILALTVAMRAREVTALQALRMLLAVAAGFFDAPTRFFFPVEDVPSAALSKAQRTS